MRTDGWSLFNGGVAISAPFLISEAEVRALAGDRSFRRGQDCMNAVSGLVVGADRVRGTVQGTDDYAVVLTRSGTGAVRASCDCPQGQQGFFCKHCVAVALTIARNKPFVPAPRSAGAETASAETAGAETASAETARAGGLVPWLGSRSSDELLDLVREQLVEDGRWRSRLELRAAGAQADVPAILGRLDGLLDAGEFAPYGYIEERDCLRYANRVYAAAAIVDELVEAGHAAEAVTVAQHALDVLAISCRDARDRSGAVSKAADELSAAHVTACESAPPDPVVLADFVTRQLLSAGDIPAIDISWYSDLLGASGLERARDRCLAATQAKGAGLREQHALEQVLRAAGDINALVTLITANPDADGREHLRAAFELDDAGRSDDALAVAEQGLRQASRADADLADYVVERYWTLGRLRDAVEARRDLFAATRDLAAFQRLRIAAQLADDWPVSREWAIGVLRADAGERSKGARAAGRRASDAVLIDVLLDEGDLDAAWTAAPGLASEAQWLRLADLAADARPADALSVYLGLIESLRNQTGDRAYERMARLLVAARECHRRLGTQATFDSYLRVLRTEQQRKPKLMAILDRHGL